MPESTAPVDGVEVVARLRAQIGECPVFDPLDHTLYCVDATAGRLWRCRPDGAVDHQDVGELLASFVLVDGGGFLLAIGSDVHVLAEWGGTPQLWQPIQPDRPTRCNDGKCDPAGRFLVGTTRARPADEWCLGALHVVDHDGAVRQLVDGVGMSNGLDWSPDGRYMYYVDSLAGSVTRFDWDADGADVSNPVRLITIPSTEGLPDGLAVDDEGCLWLAVWGASEVRRYTADGRQIATVTLPTPHVTSCAFGGAGSNELYITTAADGLNPGDAGMAEAGSVFVAQSSTTGRPPCRFRFDRAPQA